MFIKRSEYNKLKDSLEEAKRMNERLNNEQRYLRRQLKQKNTDDIANQLDSDEYTYAILVRNADVIVYNEGRIEKNIRSISFVADSKSLPTLTIIK